MQRVRIIGLAVEAHGDFGFLRSYRGAPSVQYWGGNKHLGLVIPKVIDVLQ